VYYKCISKTGSADEKVITVPMKEYGPGKYQAYFKVTEDIDQIQKIQINLLDAEGNLYTKTLGKEKEGFPLEVGATVSIDLSGVSKLEKFAGMDLVSFCTVNWRLIVLLPPCSVQLCLPLPSEWQLPCKRNFL